MAGARAFGALSVALLCATAGCGGDGDAKAQLRLAPLAQDTRLAHLLVPSSRCYHYDVNTAEIEAILEETLLHGQRDPLRRAREELGALGAPGVEIATRVVRRYWDQQDGKSHIRNCVDVLSITDDPAARGLLLEVLEHPMEDVRVQALRGLRKHGRAEDWDAIRLAVDRSSAPFLVEALQVLHAADPERTNRMFLDWIDAGDAEDLWPEVLPLLASATDPAVAERCRKLWPRLRRELQPGPAAAAAATGDEESLDTVRALRDDRENPTLRRVALLALGQAGLLEELVPTLTDDPSSENRTLAVGFLGSSPERIRAMRPHLVRGMSDPVESVAMACTRTLAAVGDESAIGRGMMLLSSDAPGAVTDGLRILQAQLAEDPELARRAFDVLVARFEESEHLPFAERTLFLVAIGQIPLEDSARYLMAVADSSKGDIQDKPALQWITMQAGSVGDVAHDLLLERFLSEDDPRHRLDLLQAIAILGSDDARDILLGLLEGEELAPYEILYAADRLVRIGPAREVAPVLKRVTLRVEQPDVRRALQCLLWTSYPGPKKPPRPAEPRAPVPAREE